MNIRFLPGLGVFLWAACGRAVDDQAALQECVLELPAGSVYALQVEDLAGAEVDLGRYTGMVTLIVNVASECGYTPQYQGLQELHAQYRDRGFAVLGFPCNDFGRQEPGTPEQIREFCTERYGVEFPLFAKVQIQGAAPAPLYSALQRSTGELPQWNFCKYLIGKDGSPLRFFPSKIAPESPELRAAIDAALES